MSLSGGTYVIVKIFGESFALPISFFLGFVLLFIDYAKHSLKKILCFVLGCSFIGTGIYWMVGFKNGLADIMQNTEMEQGLVNIYIYLEYLILPILGLVVSGLVLGCILFPEKYLKTMKGELDYG